MGCSIFFKNEPSEFVFNSVWRTRFVFPLDYDDEFDIIRQQFVTEFQLKSIVFRNPSHDGIDETVIVVIYARGRPARACKRNRFVGRVCARTVSVGKLFIPVAVRTRTYVVCWCARGERERRKWTTMESSLEAAYFLLLFGKYDRIRAVRSRDSFPICGSTQPWP